MVVKTDVINRLHTHHFILSMYFSEFLRARVACEGNRDSDSCDSVTTRFASVSRQFICLWLDRTVLNMSSKRSRGFFDDSMEMDEADVEEIMPVRFLLWYNGVKLTTQ